MTLHGTDLSHPRARPVTLAALPFLDLVATVSEPLATEIPRWAARGRDARCSPPASTYDASARSREPRRAPRSGSTRTARICCSRPTRAGPRSATTGRSRSPATSELLTLGQVDPAQVPQYVNAANAVLVPSDREGFGLAVLEALACDVPVLATPVGIHPTALDGIEGTYCGPFDDAAGAPRSRRTSQTTIRAYTDARSAERFSTDLMAADGASPPGARLLER